jgi:phage terminase large subunit-like protein
MNLDSLKNKSKAELLDIAKAIEALNSHKKYNAIEYIFPDDGVYKRSLYPKHIEFLKRGKSFSRRAFIAANRIGKSMTGGAEAVYHLTGKYPSWWEGREFGHPINMWICGITTTQIRESIQEILFGNFADKGTGLIPKDCLLGDDGIMQTWNAPNAHNMVGTCLVRHYNKLGVFDGWSKVEFKTYDQGWEKYQGAKRDVIWLDEEPTDPRIYSECATRTAGDKGNEGILYCTFTPLNGFSDVVLSYLPNGQMPEGGVHPTSKNKFVICATWDDVPHLSEQWKEEQLAEYPANEREARSRGIPTAGSGKVYPILEEDIIVQAFNIPSYFPRAYGLDFGWHCTAAIWGAKDPKTGIIYLYSEYYRGKQAPYVHAQALKERGSKLVGAADPAGGRSNEADGTILINEYINLGLNLTPAENAVVSGIARVYNLMESGRLKVFPHLQNWLTEYRTYRYDTRNPNSVAQHQKDHLMDATRYLLSIFDYISISDRELEDKEYMKETKHQINHSRDPRTGY